MEMHEIIEKARKAQEEFKKAEKAFEQARERFEKARQRYYKAREKRDKIISEFMAEFRKQTGVSIKAVKDAVAKIPHLKQADNFKALKEKYQILINGADDIQRLGVIGRKMSRLAQRERAIKKLAQHEELLDVAWRLGVLDSHEITTIMELARGGE